MPISALDLIHVPVAEWEQIPAVRFLDLVGRLPRRVEAVISAD